MPATTQRSSPVSEIVWKDGELLVLRIAGEGPRSRVLVLTPAVDHPAPASIARLEHAYGLRNELDPAWAARPVELIRHQGQPALRVEDHGGEVLASHVGRPWDLEQFLRVATGVTVALGHLHQRGLVHKDIKPAHIFANFSTGEAWLSGFGLSSRLRRERQSPDRPELLAGTLPYMAP